VVSGKRVAFFVAFCGVATWGFYALLGHRIIEFLYYKNSFQLADWLMEGRGSTALEDYLLAADHLVFNFTVGLIVGVVLLCALRQAPKRLAYGLGAFLLSSLLWVFLIGFHPALGEVLNLEVRSVPDPTLGFRYRSLYRTTIRNYRGQFYSPSHGIEVEPMTIEWATDEEGFRNPRAASVVDVIAIGDGFVSGGQNQLDTFTSRLENRLQGRTVSALGVGGHGPFQYIELLRKYGVKKQPQFALFFFNEGNDLKDIREYLRWKQESQAGFSSIYSWPFESKSLLQRSMAVISGVVNLIRTALWQLNERILNYVDARWGYARPVHKEVTVVRLSNHRRYEFRFLDRQATQSTEEIMRSEEWQHLRQLLGEFKEICVKNRIIPLMIFIPTAAHIYAEYSSGESGQTWRSIRHQQIAAKKNMQNAVARLAQDLDIELIDVTHVFEAAAKNGQMLYHPVDTHWNSDGAEIAAVLTAQRLKRRMESTGDSEIVN
jgi:hypothetical protein